MGHQELITSLEQEAREKISLTQREAETEIQKIRAELSKRIEDLREEYRHREKEEIRRHEEKARSKVEQDMRGIRLSAEKRISDRLLPLARSCLQAVRDEHYREVFAALAGELPQGTWSDIRVNPEDGELAREHFPNARVESDTGISGGLEAVHENGKIDVTNTFEKRLERAWEDLLPFLMSDAYGGVSHNESPAE